MLRLNRILYLVTQPDINQYTTELALSLAHKNGSELAIWALLPQLPEGLNSYSAKLQSVLTESLHASLRSALSSTGIGKDQVRHSIICESSWNPPLAVAIIQRVIREGFDLLIKAVEISPGTGNSEKGFPALDMTLLRKCPCPLWLNRTGGTNISKLAVAVDPNERLESGCDLGQRILQIADSLSSHFNWPATLISCWDLEHENFLRYSAFGRLPEPEVNSLVAKTKISHQKALDSLIKKSGIEGKLHVEMLKGRPSKLIPSYINENNIQLLIMGTVARTGIPGFIFGNTAESVIQNVTCSMFAVKPFGFVSPVAV